MNAIVTREELSNLIHIGIDSLRKYISRGVIIEIEKNKIDLNNPFNKNYILKYCIKKGIDAEVLIYKKIEEEPEIINDQDKSENKTRKEKTTKKTNSKKSYAQLQEEKLEKEILVKEVDAKLKNLELDKKKAKVIPTEFSIEITQRYLNGTCGAIINSGNIMIDDICKKFKIDNKDKLEYKKRLKAIVTDTIKSKHKPIMDENIAYAKEYALMIRW